MKSIFKLGIETKEVTAQLMETTIALAFKMNIIVYDACFLALAKEINTVLITADYLFYRKVGTSNFVEKLSALKL